MDDFRCGHINISPGRRSVLVDGQPRHLRPKSFDLLLYLIENRHRLVGKDELLERVWNDAAVNDNSPAQCVIELRKALGDDARSPRYIRTIAKSGYQFIGDVREEDGGIPTVELEEVTTTRVHIEQSSQRWWIAAAAVATLFAVAATIAWRWNLVRPEITLPPIAGKRPVVVMYFDNQSHSQDLDWLREGLPDMVITNLSRFDKLSVLSRHQLASNLARDGKAGSLRLEDVLKIAARAHADAVVLGSFARVGTRLRIAAQVHDARNGRLLAAESVTADLTEHMLAQVDTLAAELATDLGVPSMRRTPQAQLARLMTSNLEAYRYYSLGLEKVRAFHETEGLELFQKAAAIDPSFVLAQARVGETLAVTSLRPEEGRPYLEKAFQRSRDLTDLDRIHIGAWYSMAGFDYEEAIQRFRELLAADSAEIETYFRLGYLLRAEERTGEAIEVLKQGLAVDPDAPDLLNVLGGIYSQMGRHQEAIATLQRCVDRAPSEANTYDSLGLAYVWAGRLEEAESAYVRALALSPDFNPTHRHLATLYYQTGRYRSAIQEAERSMASAKTEPQIGAAHADLAWFFARTRDFARARGEAELAVPGVAQTSALVALRSGEPKHAAMLLQAAPARVNVRAGRTAQRLGYYLLGEIALAEHRTSEALAYYQEALRHQMGWADSEWLEDCLADAYWKLGRVDEAIAEFQRALRLFPGMGLTHYHLAAAYQAKGQRVLAVSEYRSFLELWKHADQDVPEVATAIAYLRGN